MRFAFDGLPRDLPLSPDQRGELRAKVRAWRPPTETSLPRRVATIPPAMMAVTFAILFPLMYLTRSHLVWTIALIPPALAFQIWTTRRLMHAALWPHTCRAMAANGYEVCPRCAYPLSGADPQIRQCPECGAERVRTEADSPG